MKNFIYVAIITFLVSGCASRNIYKLSAEWDKNTLAKVHVYRTTTFYHSLNPEKPFFYIDGAKIGKLGTGDAISINVLAGPHTISVKEPIMFVPAYESGSINFEAVANKEYFIRYSKEFSGIITGGTSVVTTDDSSIQMSDKSSYINRE